MLKMLKMSMPLFAGQDALGGADATGPPACLVVEGDWGDVRERVPLATGHGAPPAAVSIAYRGRLGSRE
eukprot:5652781-Pyramimonas_sp.AAC.1